jgi:MerR family transcriptional regulator, thiopeptide resistance regulator
MTYTVGQVAKLAGISVRTLHHYDAIGLLVPEDRSEAGYRRYRRHDLERLQTILAYRELGFELDAIAALLADPTADPLDALRHLAAELDARAAGIERMRRGVQKMMEARMNDLNLTPAEMLEVFGDHDPTAFAAETEERWGDTDAYRQSAARTKRYTKSDWTRIKAEADAIHTRVVSALQGGAPASGQAAMDAAEAHRAHIGRWFYDCSPTMHEHLAEMYVADPRFTATFEAIAPGLAAYLAEAIRSNARRQRTAHDA